MLRHDSQGCLTFPWQVKKLFSCDRLRWVSEYVLVSLVTTRSSMDELLLQAREELVLQGFLEEEFHCFHAIEHSDLCRN